MYGVLSQSATGGQYHCVSTAAAVGASQGTRRAVFGGGRFLAGVGVVCGNVDRLMIRYYDMTGLSPPTSSYVVYYIQYRNKRESWVPRCSIQIS